MICRYKLARAKGKRIFQAAVEEDQKLLDGLGLGLLSVEHGLRVVLKRAVRGDHINPWDVIEVSPKFWGWLRPLLLELEELRALRDEWEEPVATAPSNGSVNGVSRVVTSRRRGRGPGAAPSISP